MTRIVPSDMQGHLDQNATTTCYLLKITLKTGIVFGLTNLEITIPYDDGEGTIDYVGVNGFDPSAFSAETGFSVDNAEGMALISDVIPGIDVEMVDSGEFDDATWITYKIDFESPSYGHVIMGAGDVGEVRTRYGMLWMPELLDYVARLRQPIGGVWSTRCRAVFGTPAASPTGCGVDITPLWETGTVTSVGAESNRTFSGSAVGSSEHPVPYPGRVQWLTGDNAGRQYDVDSVDSDGITLTEVTIYPITIGDTYRIRPDCGKRFTEDCIQTWNNGVNFKGEPHIPTGDAAEVQTPGAKKPGRPPLIGGGSG